MSSFKPFTIVGLVGLWLVSACAPAPVATGVNDPWEAANRRTHALNKTLDSTVLRPMGQGYVSALPEPVVTGVGNFAGNIATPGLVVNNLLQADVKGAFTNTVRLVVNSTLGMGGVFDVATMAGIYEVDTDFGETLYVWGVPEGAYLELPVLGPSTERDTVGRVVDLFTNPLGYVLDAPEKYAGPASNVLKRLGDRGRYAQTVDSVLYDSTDSYAQGRSTYLQNRRYKLGGAAAAEDPYADPYAAGDPYDDPYLQ